MKPFFASMKIHFAVLVCSLSLLSACATNVVDAEKVDAESAVQVRAMARWSALLNGDLQAAYEFLSPALRSSVSSLQYQRSVLLQKVQWKDAKFIEAVCEETICNVKISLDFTIRGALPGVRSFEETDVIAESWVLVDDVWYYVPEQ